MNSLQQLELLDTIAKSAGLFAAAMVVVSCIFFRLFLLERKERREAWSKNNEITTLYNEAFLKITVVLEGVKNALEKRT